MSPDRDPRTLDGRACYGAAGLLNRVMQPRSGRRAKGAARAFLDDLRRATGPRSIKVDSAIQMTVKTWLKLPAALSLAERLGLSEALAKAEIASAICGRSIEFQGALGRRDTHGSVSHGTVFEGRKFQVPVDLKPDDFDWELSRPHKAWWVPREYSPYGWWSLYWIELLESDVAEVCGAFGKRSPSVEKAASGKGRAKRTKPAHERCGRALLALYPDGLPEQADLPNINVCKAVGEYLKNNGLPGASDDSILRAAGRRRK